MEYTGNFGIRTKPVDMIIIHSMSEEIRGMFAPHFLERIGLSCHYYIKPNGEIIQTLENEFKAYHAGESEWKGQTNLNENSIGIELLISGSNTYEEFLNRIKKPETFTKAHYRSLHRLCTELMKEHPAITYSRILRHSDVSGKHIRPDNPKYDVGSGFDYTGFIENLKMKIERRYLPDPDKSNFKSQMKDILSNSKKRIKEFGKVLF